MSDPIRKPGEPENADEVRDYFENLRNSGESQEILEESKRRHGAGIVVILLILFGCLAALQIFNWIMRM